jgi:hypothetical protein
MPKRCITRKYRNKMLFKIFNIRFEINDKHLHHSQNHIMFSKCRLIYKRMTIRVQSFKNFTFGLSVLSC